MQLNIGGEVFLGLAWGIIIILTTFCFYKVIRSERKNKV